MGNIKTNRPYRERFLDNFDRSQLRREVEAVRPRKLKGLRKKYATWALGASLALGGMGMPLKMIKSHHGTSSGKATTINQTTTDVDRAVAPDLADAQSIAKQVAGGVVGGVEAAVSGVEAAASNPLQAIAEAPKKLAIVTEQARQDFFHKEVPFGSIIYQEAKKNDLRPELLAAIVQAESKFKPTARSGAGAIGLMQLVPRTGRWMGARDLTNPGQNIMAGAKYVRYLHDRFNGDETAVIAAYNAGEGNVKRFRGVPPFKETRNYVKRVRGFEEEFRNRVDNRMGDAQVADAR